MKFSTRLLAGIALMACIVCMVACKTKPADAGNTNAPNDDVVMLYDSTVFYNIEAMYPVEPLDKKGEMKAWVMQLVEDRKEAWKIGGELYNTEKEIAAEFPDRPSMKYDLIINYTKSANTSLGIVSYIFTLYEFTGGAHGNASVMAFNFNRDGKVEATQLLELENGKDIALSRLLASEAIKEEEFLNNQSMLMEGLGLAYLKEDGKTFDAEACGCDGFLFASNFENFTLDDEGITVHFSNYQIAPYSSGLPEIKLSMDQLAPFLKAPFGK